MIAELVIEAALCLGSGPCAFDESFSQVSRHNYNEVCSNLSDVISKLQIGNYDLRNSSRLLRMAVCEHYSSMQMQMMLNNVDVVMKNWDVDIPENPDIPKGYTDVDIKQLEDLITDEYTNRRSRKLFYYEMNMMSIDVDSILYTYRIRGNSIARSLKSSKAILLTTNRAIARASNSSAVNVKRHQIPVCTTDMFLSTILWTNYPRENEQLNRKLLISDCYNTIQLNDSLLDKFFKDVKEKRLASDISESQYLALTTSNLSLKLLGDKTLNDINAYTDRTTAEILDIIEQEHKDEIEAIKKNHEEEIAAIGKSTETAIAEIQSVHETAVAEKDNKITGLSSTISYAEAQYEKDAKLFANIISGCIAGLIGCLFLIKSFPEWLNFLNEKPFSIVWLVIKIILSLWAVLNWSGFIPRFADVKNVIYQKRYTHLCKKYLNRQS